MDVTSGVANRHSEEEFLEKFSTLIDAGAGTIHVRTGEVIRAAIAIRKHALLENGVIQEWDVVNGFRNITNETFSAVLQQGDGNVDATAAMFAPLQSLRSGDGVTDIKYFVYLNPHPFFENNPVMAQLLALYRYALPSTNVVVVLITPDIPLRDELSSTVIALGFSPPGLAELRKSLEVIVNSTAPSLDNGSALTEEDIDKVCYVGAGLSKTSFEIYSALSIIQGAREGRDCIHVDDLVKGVSVGKTEVVQTNDILELYPTTDINNVGGLENLKAWVARRKNCYSDEAKAFGIEPPKGLVLVGVPGSGKSLTARAIASEFGVPLVRLDFGRVFNSLVGASEHRMRTALTMVEDMAPVVLFVDEIDKGLGGAGGSGDSGTSSRVLGSFLTWLNDCKQPVFTIVTANNVTHLPPEMLRRGRFDGIFSTSLPTARERREVLRIHLGLRNRDISEFSASEIAGIVNISEGYVPSEIESAVKDALIDAYSEGEELQYKHIERAFAAMVPLSKAFAPQIEAMTAWAKANATPAGLEDNTIKHRETSVRRIRPRTTGKGE